MPVDARKSGKNQYGALTPRNATLSITIPSPPRGSSSNDQLSRIPTYNQASILLVTLIAIREAIVTNMEAPRAAIILRARGSARAVAVGHVAVLVRIWLGRRYNSSSSFHSLPQKLESFSRWVTLLYRRK